MSPVWAKFRDVELVGIPFRITVGKRALEEGAIELTERINGQTRLVPLADVADEVQNASVAAL